MADEPVGTPGTTTPEGAKTDATPTANDAMWAAHRRQLKETQRRAKELEEKLAAVENASKTEHERAIEAARKEEREKANAEMSAKLRAETVKRRLVAQGISEDFAALIPVEADDEVDAAVSGFIEKHPELKAGGQPRPVGAGGTQQTTKETKIEDLTEEQILRLPPDKFKELVKAGRFDYVKKG